MPRSYEVFQQEKDEAEAFDQVQMHGRMGWLRKHRSKFFLLETKRQLTQWMREVDKQLNKEEQDADY